MAAVSDPSGRVEPLVYDPAGRRAERRFSLAAAGEELTVTFSYDEAGRRTRMADQHGDTVYRHLRERARRCRKGLFELLPAGTVDEMVSPNCASA